LSSRSPSLSAAQDVNSLASNLQQLRNAQERFTDSAAAVNALPPDADGRELLVPLTSSLFVPGRLQGATEELLVDIGTGYYVGKPAAEAAGILSRKAAMLKANIDGVNKAIAVKRGNLEAIGEALTERRAAGQT
jgi:prefoldin alpha subunit